MSFDFSFVCGFRMWNLPGFPAAHTWQQSPRVFVRLGYGIEWRDFLTKIIKAWFLQKHTRSPLQVEGSVLQSDENQVELSGPTLGPHLPLERCLSTTQTKHPFLHDKTWYFNRSVWMLHINHSLIHFSVSAFTGKFRAVFTFDGLNLFNGL